MTSVRQLGYLGLEVANVSSWEPFAVDLLGLQVARRGDDGSIGFRMDNYEQRVVLHPGSTDDVAYLGFEVAGEAELDALRADLQREGIGVEEGSKSVCAKRRVARLLQLKDPNGIPIELYSGAAIAKEPFRSKSVAMGFVAGDEGFGHVVLCVKDAKATEHFYVDLLGMRLSDRVCVPMANGSTFDITFLHANARHHSVAFMSAPTPKRLHHFMLEVGSVDDVGRARDRALEAGIPLTMDIGKHPNDRMLSFYFKSPSGFDVEIGNGGVKVDDSSWNVRTYDHPSLWGHKRPTA